MYVLLKTKSTFYGLFIEVCMTGCLNKISLIGCLGKDPEIRTVPNTNRSVASFSLATTNIWKDKNSGEIKNKTEWHTVVVWNAHLVGLVQRYLKKGHRVFIEGELCYRKWQDKNTGANHISAGGVMQNFGG